MSELNHFTQIEKPTFAEFKYCVGVDLTADRLDALVVLLPEIPSISVSTMLHTKDLDDFCRDMLLLFNDYVNIELWINDADVGLKLLNFLDVKPDFILTKPDC